MVSIKDAFLRAAEFATSVLEPSRTTDLRLEEVETGDQNGVPVWILTLSMKSPEPVTNAIALSELISGKRDYKAFTIRKDNGEVLSMKIREFAAT